MEHQIEPERRDRGGVEVVVAVLAVVEVEAAELAEAGEAGDDLLDVDGRRVVAEVDQALGLRPEVLGGETAAAPVGNHRRIEGRLEQLVLEQHAPVVGQRAIDRRGRIEIAVERARQARLAGEIRAVADPHRQRLRAQRAADLDALDIVGDRLLAHRLVGMGERAELVRQRLARLVLEGVGVDGVERETVALRRLAQLGVVLDLVPREMRRDGRREAGQRVDHAAIGELVEDVARLAGTGKAGEARAARADAPARHGDGEGHRVLDQRLGVEPAPRQLARERLEVLAMIGEPGPVLVGDEIGGYGGHGVFPNRPGALRILAGE